MLLLTRFVCFDGIFGRKKLKWKFMFQLNPYIGFGTKWLVVQILNVTNIYIYTVFKIYPRNILKPLTKTDIGNTDNLITPELDSYPESHNLTFSILI